MSSHSAGIKNATFEPLALRNVLGNFATGVTIMTTVGDNGAPVGITVNSFASVSLDPPLVLWSIDLSAPSLSAFRKHSSFAINIICDQSADLALKFARPAPDKFAGVDWDQGLDGIPILNDAAAVIECQTESRIDGGDHEIYIGRVIDFRETDKSPLLFHRGKFASLGEKI